MQLVIYKRDQGFKLGTTRREQIQLAVLNLRLPGLPVQRSVLLKDVTPSSTGFDSFFTNLQQKK